MQKFLSALSILVVCLFCYSAPTLAAEPTFAENEEAHLKEATSGESSGVAVLVARDGTIVFQGGFGYADIENKTPVTPETKFRIGSVSKQFTAAAMRAWRPTSSCA